ncbi:DUF3311 domain-containing protein [Streptomyces beihaiensis]|uniref:DUF3311 domain-containing protein n=1 Tax=Streptomyces beihaiensis TaxID=2984495 RepID=A0ABT3TT52_9ACTN|nr:DUF3311 domain-containing protein [Streptomyces beihaiensis]MCX3060197.1 DUF3311 domain-containing protein [Streptomyces beihaiensis]
MSNTPDAPEVSRPVVTPVRIVVALCLVAPFVAMLWVGSYTRTDPTFIGIPFFYWYQVSWVIIAAVFMAIAYKLWQYDERTRKSGGRS